MKHLRVEIEEEQFHRFKRLMNSMGLQTNDEALVCLMDEYESSPSVDEAKEVLKRQGYKIVEKDD